MRDELLQEFQAFKDQVGWSESYMGKRAGVGTAFFDRLREGAVSLRTVDAFRKFMTEYRQAHNLPAPPLATKSGSSAPPLAEGAG